MKYDGYRILIAVGGGEARAYTRSGLDWSGRFPAILSEAGKLKVRSALIDGEAVVIDAEGRSSFQTLQKEQVREITDEIDKAIPDDDRVIALDRVLANIDKSAVIPKNKEGIKADITGCRIRVPQIEEAAATGAALLAGMGIGAFHSGEEAAGALQHDETTYMPQQEAQVAYDDIYHQTYLPACQTVLSLPSA